MAFRDPSKIANEDLSYQRKRYTILELLDMRHTLPYVCCPVNSFKPEAWSEKILTRAVPVGDFLGLDAKYNVKILASKLDSARRQELLSRQQKEEALDRLVIRKKHQNRRIPPKPVVMPTIPEVLSPAIPATLVQLAAPAIIRSVSLNTGLSGGYGKKILSDNPSDNGLMTSMHAFVPGGKLKTAPITAIDAGDSSDWGMRNALGIRRSSSTLSLSDGLGLRGTSPPVPVTAAAPAAITTTRVVASEGAPPITKAESIKSRAVTNDTANIKVKAGTLVEETVRPTANLGANVENEPFIEKPRALMGKRSTGAEQLTWIQIMMSKSIVSGSQKAPQVKEALGAVTETPGDNDKFMKAKELDIFDDFDGAIATGW